jgi:hypothetical protein
MGRWTYKICVTLSLNLIRLLKFQVTHQKRLPNSYFYWIYSWTVSSFCPPVVSGVALGIREWSVVQLFHQVKTGKAESATLSAILLHLELLLQSLKPD